MWKLPLLLCLISFGVHAKSLELKEGARSIFLKEKTGWELGKELFGIPYIYFSPQINGERSNISFTDTGANLELESKALGESQADYQKDKQEWAQEVGATPLGYVPYSVSRNQFGHKIHKLGFNFKHEGQSYNETSFYIECRGRIIFAKSLRLSQNEQHDKDFFDLIDTLDCGGV